MKILLVRPAPPKYTIGLKNIMVCEPLELEYIAAGLPDHEVEIFDMIFEKNLTKKIKTYQPDIIGTSSYITGINEVKQIGAIAKNANNNIITVVGGVHATLNPGDFEDPNIDIIVRGQGIKAFAQIANNISVESIPGVFNSLLPISHTESEDILKIDVNELPIPRRDLVKKHANKYYYVSQQPVTIIKTSFGCPFHCKFCYCWRLTGGKVYSRSAESVINELEHINNHEVYIIDDTFFVNKKHVMDIHRLILEKDIRKNYLVYGHTDFIIKNPDVIEDWSKIGLKACIIGLESPLDSELNDYEKNATVEKNSQAIQILQNNKVDVYASFIVDPAWTINDFDRLQEYIYQNKLYYIVIQPLTPLPGTEMYNQYQNSFSISETHSELWDMQHSVIRPALGEKEFYKQIRKVYRNTVLNPFRVATLNLSTSPSIFSKKYIRLLLGCLKIYMDLRKARKHSALLNISK